MSLWQSMLSFERVIWTTIAFDPNNLVLKKPQTKQLYVWAPAIIEPKKNMDNNGYCQNWRKCMMIFVRDTQHLQRMHYLPSSQPPLIEDGSTAPAWQFRISNLNFLFLIPKIHFYLFNLSSFLIGCRFNTYFSKDDNKSKLRVTSFN